MHVLTTEQHAKIEETVFQDRVKVLHDYLLTTSLPATFVCATILFIGLYGDGNKTLLVDWYTSILVISLLRICLLWFYRLNSANSRLHLNLFIIGSTIAALIWSIASIMLVPANNANDLILTIIIIAGITAGASQTLQASRAANFLFILITILPLSAWLTLENENVHYAVSAAVLGYMVFMLELAQKGYVQLCESLRLRHINTFLVKELSETNTNLLNEISERKQTQEQLDYLASHDSLTELPNRYYFQSLFHQTLMRAHKNTGKFTVLFLDIDHFKSINDSYGHFTGDMLLCQVAARLKKNLRANDTIARVGGDEFIILLENMQDDEYIEKFIKRIHRAFRTAFHVNKHSLTVTLSMGISVYPDDGKNKNILLKKADIALYRAKELGRNRTEYYETA